VLTGFLRCEHCGCILIGQTQIIKGVEYKYYIHSRKPEVPCRAFSSIDLEGIENAIFSTIFENFDDLPAFERAIAESLPDENMINGLQDKIKLDKKILIRVDKDLDKLIDIALAGRLATETIKERETKLIEERESSKHRLEENENLLQSLPDINDVQEKADQIRRQLLEQCSGKDAKGSPYCIYINKTPKGVDYFMYGRIVGLRTLRGDDINYQDDDISYKSLDLTKHFTGIKIIFA
jgi:hypothetical protein